MNPEGKKFYLNNVYGKTFLLILWVILIIANLICLVRMRYQSFRDWCILSLVGFFTLVFIIDPILYFILAAIMLKHQNSEGSANDNVRRGSLGRKSNSSERSNDQSVEYYTGKNSAQTGSCAKMFVTLFIGKEKMKDLRRRLNPYSPI